MAKRDYYEALGVERSAGEDDIKKAYRKIAFESHPDRNPGNAEAEKRFKEATEAYEVLRDSDKRSRYDQFGHAAVGGSGGSPQGFDISGFDLADALRAFMRDFGGQGDFGDIFGNSGGRGGSARTRGDDLQVRVVLTFEEIATGVEKKIRVKHLKSCSTCDGKGGTGETACTQCQGRGQVRRVQQSVFGQFVNISTCPRCAGAGRTVTDPCKTCSGEGRVSETETVSVKVPPGVAAGNFIPLRGLGDAGLRAGPPGDLIVLIDEKEHAVFDRHGDDLLVDVPITFPTATLGGKVELVALDGAKVTLSVPAGTPSGQVLRLRGRGLPGLRGGKGDMLARVIVWVPERVGSAEKKLLEELNHRDPMKPPRPGKTGFERARNAAGSGTPALVYLPDVAAIGESVRLSPEEARYVARVCRVRPGERVSATDGRGALVSLVVEAVGDDVTARVDAVERVARGRRAWVITGAPERGREDLLVEKLAELGIERWMPVHAAAGRWESSRARPERWARIAIAAMRQSLGPHLMAIDEPVGLVEAIRQLPPDSIRWLASIDGASEISPGPFDAAVEVVAVGPAAGFTVDELRALAEAAFRPVRLASRRLRTETAAISWASCWAARPAGPAG